MKTFIIAEAGANHDKNFDQAIKLIDIAKESGADACKFQTYSSETLYTKNTPDFAGYRNINQLIKDIELPREWQIDLKKYGDDSGMEFMSTPFDEQAIYELLDIGVKRFKISGFESTDFRFVEMVASAKLPIIISMGIGFPLEYIGKLYSATEKYETEITLLHCNNAYPTPIEDIRLGTLNDIKYEMRNYPRIKQMGLSDHTMSTRTPAIAVAMGASVIEKHFTLDRSLDGPDHPFALEPYELTEMVSLIRETEVMMKTQESLYSKSETQFKHARRSVVSKVPLKVGDILTRDKITTKRPYFENNIPAGDFELVIGKKILTNVNEDVSLTLDMVDVDNLINQEVNKDEQIINQIEKIRARNNVNWMDAVRLAFELDENRARKIFKDIKECDFLINELLEELADG
jgi:sialic acid synthase SpsE